LPNNDVITTTSTDGKVDCLAFCGKKEIRYAYMYTQSKGVRQHKYGDLRVLTNLLDKLPFLHPLLGGQKGLSEIHPWRAREVGK
jgi:hypothetical protein